MGLASKIQAAGPRPGAVAPQQSTYGQQSAPGQQQQASANPPYPVPQQSGQYGSPAPQLSTKPGGYSANQPSSNPYAQNPAPPQSQYGAPQAQQPGSGPQGQQSRPGQYGTQQLPGPYGAQQIPGQYGQQAQGQYGAQQPLQTQYGNQLQPGQYGSQQSQGQYGSQQYGGQQQVGQQGAPQQGGYPGQGAPPLPGRQQTGNNATQSGSADASVISNNLNRIVRENQLEVFYPPQRLQQVIQKVLSLDFRSLAASWDIPMEIATDLAALALYDIVLYCDDSGSMIAEEKGERIEDLKLILSRVSEVATMFDDDGIQVRFMNSNVEGNGIRDAQAAGHLISQVRFSGITPLGTQLDRRVIQPLVLQQIRSRSLQKPVLVVVITDGEPVGEPRDLTRRIIAGTSQQTAQQGYPGAVRFQFAQVGKDMKAQAFLGELDNDPQIGKVIDAISYFELEAQEFERKNGVMLTPDLWLVKLCVGAIDASYDEQDE